MGQENRQSTISRVIGEKDGFRVWTEHDNTRKPRATLQTFIGRQFSWFLISMRIYVSAHTKAIVVGRQIDRKIVARTYRLPFNKKVGQLLIEHGVLCECAHSPTIQSVIRHTGSL
jgi:hypothetical protein